MTDNQQAARECQRCDYECFCGHEDMKTLQGQTKCQRYAQLRQRLAAIEREWMDKAEKESAESKDKRWAEWVRDRSMVTAATITYCAYGLRVALEELRHAGTQPPPDSGE